MARGALSVALVMGSVNAACVNPRPAPRAIAPEMSGAAPEQMWTSRVGRRLTGRVEIEDGTIYGAGADRKVYAVNLETGAVKWSHRISGPVGGGVLVSGDTLFVASSRPDGRVYAIDRRNGQRLWRSKAGAIAAPLSMVGGVLIAGTQNGVIAGLDPKSGNVKWRRPLGVARIAAHPVGDSATVVATVDSLFRLLPRDGGVTHRVKSPGSILSPWIEYHGALVAGTTDSQVVAIAPADLRQQWSVRLDAPVLASPAAKGDTLFAASRRGSLFRIVANSLPRADRIVELEWAVTAPVAVVGEQIVLGGADGTLRALRADGREIWRLRIWRPVELRPIALDDGILAIGGEGDIHRYRQ
jgi:outer membrane protein assembly factor BamB